MLWFSLDCSLPLCDYCRAFGLWLDGELDRGSTATCAAFNNAPLTGNGEVDFKSAAVEVFYCSNS